MINPLPRLVAEFLGAFTLVFAGVGASIVAYLTQDQSPMGAAFATGLAIFVMVTVFISVSGAHFNPAVSFAMLVTGRLPFADFIAYVAAQLAGAVTASVAINYAMAGRVSADGIPGVPSARVEWFAALGVEAVLTMILVLVVFGVAVDRRNSMGAMAGLPIGMVITMAAFVAGPATGAALNPARWFGPMVLQGAWGDIKNIAIYTVGPLLGAFLAAVLYDYVIAPRKIIEESARGTSAQALPDHSVGSDA